MCLRALDTTEPLDRFLEIKAQMAALTEELDRLKAEITDALWDEPEHRTLYQGCEITLSVRRSYQYSEEIQAHEKALKEAKMVERLTGRAIITREASFPLVRVLRTKTT